MNKKIQLFSHNFPKIAKHMNACNYIKIINSKKKYVLRFLRLKTDVRKSLEGDSNFLNLHTTYIEK